MKDFDISKLSDAELKELYESIEADNWLSSIEAHDERFV